MKKLHVVPPGNTKRNSGEAPATPNRREVFAACFVFRFACSGQRLPSKGQRQSGKLGPGPDERGSGVAGNPIQGLTSQQLAFFQNGLSQFNEEEGVALPSPGNGGLGPAFNSDSCGSCHSQPAPGGTSPNRKSPIPMLGKIRSSRSVSSWAAATKSQFFVTADGPDPRTASNQTAACTTRSRFAGRCDAGMPTWRSLTSPPKKPRTISSFRIPTPVFGAGLIENISEDTLLANLARIVKSAVPRNRRRFQSQRQ